MDVQTFENVLEKARQCRYFDAADGCAEETISKAEQILNINFSPQQRLFLSKYGYLSFFGNEFMGILKEDFSGVPAMGIVECALLERKESALPSTWVPIYNLDDGYMAYLAYDRLNSDGEPAVFAGICTDTGFVKEEQIAQDYGEFIEQRVDDILSEPDDEVPAASKQQKKSFGDKLKGLFGK